MTAWQDYGLKRLGFISFVIALLLVILWTPAVLAQRPAPELRLFAWSSDGSFWVATSPGPVVTTNTNATQQLQTIWRISLDGQTRQRLVDGYDLSHSQDGQLIIFTRVEGTDQETRWQLDLSSGQVEPLRPGQLSTPNQLSQSDPAGQVVLAPDGQQRVIVVNRFFQAELWLDRGDGQPQRLLAADGQRFSDVVWRPDSRALAFIRTPVGSGTAAAGELWWLDLDDGQAQQLSFNNASDQAPLWHPDGQRLAVVRNGTVVIVPADEPQYETFEIDSLAATTSATPQTQLTPPAEIRVIHHQSNTCRNVPVGQIDTIPFETYVKQVVPNEVFPSWPAETLKAQAVAARTYSWYFINQDPDAAYHVTDWINFQYMCDSTAPSTDQAVEATAGQYLAYNNQPIIAFFSAENASPTRSASGLPYIRAIDDPVSFRQTRNGHGWGMGQWGAQRWADQHQWSYQAILHHYYTGIRLETGAAITDTQPPIVALIAPPSDHYQTGNQLWLRANISDDGQVISETKIYLTTSVTNTLLFSETGAMQATEAGYLLDMTSFAEQSVLTGGLVFTAEAVDSLGQRAVSPPVTIGLDRVEPTGHLTSINFITPTTFLTDTIATTISLAITDTTSGVQQMALGSSDWEVGAEAFTPTVGGLISDTAALDGTALRATVATDEAGQWRSDILSLPPGKLYRTYFRLKISDTMITDEVVFLEVYEAGNVDPIGVRRLRGFHFREADIYQEFHVDFDYGASGLPLEFRVSFLDVVDLALDRMVVLNYPVPLTADIPYQYRNLRLKVIDQGGNVSTDLRAHFESLGHERYLPLIVR